MSDKRCVWPRRLGVALGVWTVCTGVQAREWEDIATTPFIDPLLTRPLVLDTGKVLPGDGEVHTCIRRAFDPVVPLTLADAIDLALCHNPQVQSAWASIKVQAAQMGETRANYLPTLNAGMSHISQKTQYPESQFQVNTNRSSQSQFYTLTWRLLDFGGRGANRRSANALLDAALASHDAVLQKTMANVIGLYFDAQTAGANREAKEKNEALAKQTLHAAKKREARGVGAQSDTLQARTALAKAELEHARSIGIHEKSLVGLMVVLGLQVQDEQPQGTDVQRQGGGRGLALAPDYQDDGIALGEDLREWLRLSHAQHPAVLAARAQLVSAKEKLLATRSEGLPTLDFAQSEYVNGRPNQGLTSMQTKESVVGVTLNSRPCKIHI